MCKTLLRSVFLYPNGSIGMNNIILVGFMGTGKTTVGQQLATQLGMPLLDMDHLIETAEEKSISQIFEDHGEAYFRNLERVLVQQLAPTHGNIISTGGGIVLNPDNLVDFAQHGLVVCLTATPQTILQRLRDDQNRPLLAGEKEKQVQTLLTQRQSLYSTIAFQVKTDARSPQEIVDSILIEYHQQFG